MSCSTASLARRSLASITFLLAASGLVSSACSAPSEGALMLVISTDMQTPKDLDVVSVFITIGGTLKLDYLGAVPPNGSLALPATPAVVQAENASAQVHIRVIGFRQQDGQENARVLRDVL